MHVFFTEQRRSCQKCAIKRSMQVCHGKRYRIHQTLRWYINIMLGAQRDSTNATYGTSVQASWGPRPPPRASECSSVLTSPSSAPVNDSAANGKYCPNGPWVNQGGDGAQCTWQLRVTSHVFQSDERLRDIVKHNSHKVKQLARQISC